MGKVALDLEADIQPVSDFRANASALIQQARDSGRPLVLTQRGRSAAVVIDIRSYQRLLDEIEELRDVQRGLADVAAGRVVAHEDVVARVEARLKR
jgi:prevent-host-death family protein